MIPTTTPAPPRFRASPLSDDQILQARIKIEHGEPIYAVAKSIITAEGRTASPSALLRRLKAEHPGWYADMKAKGRITNKRGPKGQARDLHLENLAKHPAVVAVMRGMTYDKAHKTYLGTEFELTRSALQRWVKQVSEYTGELPKNSRAYGIRKRTLKAERKQNLVVSQTD